jgi:alkylation response protein AidB-like acyl-CoA dehydrogenase
LLELPPLAVILTCIKRQSVENVLIDNKGHIEARRSLTCRTAGSLYNGSIGADELAYEDKIYASDATVRTVAEAMRLVGLRSHGLENWPFARLTADATVLPSFNGGDQGIRRRQIQAAFQAVGHEPWASPLGSHG